MNIGQATPCHWGTASLVAHAQQHSCFCSSGSAAPGPGPAGPVPPSIGDCTQLWSASPVFRVLRVFSRGRPGSNPRCSTPPPKPASLAPLGLLLSNLLVLRLNTLQVSTQQQPCPSPSLRASTRRSSSPTMASMSPCVAALGWSGALEWGAAWRRPGACGVEQAAGMRGRLGGEGHGHGIGRQALRAPLASPLRRPTTSTPS